MPKDRIISERGRALIIAAAVLDRPNADPDDDIAVLARQLTRAQEEINSLRGTTRGIALPEYNGGDTPPI